MISSNYTHTHACDRGKKKKKNADENSVYFYYIARYTTRKEVTVQSAFFFN